MSERNLIIPCYDPYPGPAWEIIFENTELVWAVIINVASGSGPILDPVYVAMITRLKAAGIKCIGYVSTKYGARPLAEVSGEVQTWEEYGVQGIFLDEMSSAAAGLAYYRRASGICYATVGAGSIVVMNPGAVPDPQYATIAGVILTVAETDEDTYANRDFPAWLAGINDRTYHIVYGVTDAPWVWAAVAKNNPRYVYLCTTPDPKPQFSINDTIWPATPVPPAEPPTPVTITENEATKILIETANIIGGVGTLKDVPDRAREIMTQLNYLRVKSEGALADVKSKDLIDELSRRLFKEG